MIQFLDMLKALLKKFNLSYSHLLIIGLLLLTISLNQYIIGKKNLEMGFFTDDWLFLSAYRTYVVNPFLDIMSAWKQIGSHNFSYSYYIGVLYSFFGLDYSAYRITNQIFKIIATLSLYPLVLYISKRRLLAFLSTFIYAIHFSSFGLLDGPSRGSNFIAIALMSLFLLVYFYISEKKISNIFISFSLSVWLFTVIFFGSTRLFPLLVIVPFIELLNIWSRIRKGVGTAIKRLLIVYSPFLLLFLFSPKSISDQIGYFGGLFEKLKDGNWQLFLTPFAAMGSTYIPKDLWPLFGQPFYHNLSSYLTSLLIESILVYFVLLIFIVFFISRKPIKFLARNLIFSFIVGIFVYLIDHNWLLLNITARTPVDPGTFLTPALIGLFIMTTSFCLFLEWKESEKKNSLLPFLFLAPIFSLIFIFLTWLFADINSIFMGVHAYLTIPSIGTSIVLATVLVLIYDRLISSKILLKKILALQIIILSLGLFFYISFVNVDQFFSKWLNEGLRISDQQRIMDKFWSYVQFTKHSEKDIPPLIYIDSSEDYQNGSFYSEVIIWRAAAWFDLKYKKPKEGRYSLCDIVIINKEDILNYLHLGNDKTTLVYDKCGQAVSHKLDDFYAFKLKNRDIYPMRTEILKELGVEQ